jgi:ADP-ribosylglycohydrolase
MNCGFLVSLAVADSYGAGYEYADPKAVQKGNDLKTYRPHPRGTIKPGHYTDDTQMAVALAEYMLGHTNWTTLGLADAFVSTFKRDPRPGYAGGFYKLLVEVKDGTELLRTLTPHSGKSGGAMRAAPCGLLPTEGEVIDRAMWQASLTHATADGMQSAAAAALLVYGCRHGVKREDLDSYLLEFLPGYDWVTPWSGPVGSSGLHAAHAALTALQRRGNLRHILWECVNFTGDVDTVAAISLAAAAAHPQIEQDLPACLVGGLENGPYGRDYLAGIDVLLEQKFPLNPTSTPNCSPRTCGKDHLPDPVPVAGPR